MAGGTVLHRSSVAIAVLGFALLLAVAWALLATSSTAQRFVLRPVDLPSAAATQLRFRSFASIDGPRVAVVGDSVALGQVLSTHQVPDWQYRELSSALEKALSASGQRARVVNFAANGLRPADMASLLGVLLDNRAVAIVIVVNLRGFSRDFEAEDQQYLAPWYRELNASSWGNRAPFRGLMDLLLHQWTGARLHQWLTHARALIRGADPGGAEALALQSLRLRQRLASVLIDTEERFQARALLQALRRADAAGVPVTVVYATENPRDARRMLPPPAFQRHRAALENLVSRSGSRHAYLGPDATLTESQFVDDMHLTPEGYVRMAERIAPVVADQLRAK